jgi:hypothetical protein
MSAPDNDSNDGLTGNTPDPDDNEGCPSYDPSDPSVEE